jgi:hypothetical protein
MSHKMRTEVHLPELAWSTQMWAWKRFLQLYHACAKSSEKMENKRNVQVKLL